MQSQEETINFIHEAPNQMAKTLWNPRFKTRDDEGWSSEFKK